jgi:hypothetical protein
MFLRPSLEWDGRFGRSAQAAPDEDRLIAHPRFVLRIAGDPLAAVTGLTGGSAVEGLGEAAAAVAEAKRLVPSVCGLLEQAHPRLASREAANALLRVKRDFYNLRLPPPKALERLLPCLADAERATVEAMAAAIEGVAAAQAAAEHAYHEETQFTFRELARRFSDHNLRDALQRSNPFLAEKLDRLHAGEAMSMRDTLSLTMALFSYLHRAALKTSPRSSLTVVATGTWATHADSDGDPLALPAWTLERTITARFGLIERLFQPLLHDAGALGGDARLRLNATARLDGETLVWRRALKTDPVEQETYGTGEATAKVQVNRGLDLLLRALNDGGPDGLPLSALTEALKQGLSEDQRPAIPRLLQSGLTHDIVDASPALAEQVDRLVWAKAALRQLDARRAAPLASALARFEKALEACRAAAGDAILPAYRELEDAFGGLAVAAGSPIGIEAARPIVHEDCTVDAPSLKLAARDLGKAGEDLPWLLHMLPLLRGYGWPQLWLTARFLEEFGASGRCDDPEAFFLAAADQLEPPGKKAPGDGERVQLGRPPDHPAAVEADRVAQSFAAAVLAANRGREEWDVPHGLIREHYAALPETLRRRARSHSINAQPLGGADGGGMVINAVYPGNARMMARFLKDGTGGQGDVRAYLEQLAGGRYAAIPGVFGFNANAHLPLADSELSLPPRRPDYDAGATLPLDRLHLAYDAAQDRLVLRDCDGTKIEAFYFGILNSQALPPVHRMLDWMSGSVNSLFSIAGAFPARRVDEATGLIVQPRMRLGSLVLARSARTAPVALLPDPRASDYRFFVELQAFCARYGIARQTFFRFHGGEGGDARAEGNPRAPKWRKPMFLDVTNPLAVRTLQRALRRHQGTIEFAETLPGPDAARVTVNGAPHVAELSFEMGFRGG